MIPAGVRVFLCREPVDMRLGIEGLGRAAREVIHEDPAGGGLFVFVGRDGRRLKMLWVDGHGTCVLYRRLAGARFVLPRRDGALPRTVETSALAELLRGARGARCPWPREKQASSRLH